MSLPQYNATVRTILGRPNFICAPIAQLLRDMGYVIARRAEDEQAQVLYWAFELYDRHGDSYFEVADKLFRQLYWDAHRA